MTEKLSAKTAVVKYQSPTAMHSKQIAVIATACMFALLPLPILYGTLVPSAQVLPMVILSLISLGSILFFMFAFFAYKLNRNTRFILTDTGIALPGPTADPKQIIPWTKVDLIEVTSSDSDESIEFTLKGWAPIRLKVSSLSHEDLDKLVSACELWAGAAAKGAAFKHLVERVTLKRRDTEDASFTALWMEEAQRRLSTTPFSPLEPGKLLQSGRVKVVQPLTAGGWSAIYLCQWQERTSAILKEAVVPPTAKEDLKNKAYTHFERESVLLAGLDHPQIAKVLDYFIEEGRQYMILQRISGANLRMYIRDKGAVSRKQALKWLSELAKIISYLHSQQPPIVHRDLTPENLILDMTGSLVLIDFGSANEFVGTVTGTLVGKPSYIAPEQFSGHAKPQSDLYALGAVLHFLLTGKDPEPLTIASPKTSNPLVDDEVDQLVRDLTQLEIGKRLQSARELEDRLTALIQLDEQPEPNAAALPNEQSVETKTDSLDSIELNSNN